MLTYIQSQQELGNKVKLIRRQTDIYWKFKNMVSSKCIGIKSWLDWSLAQVNIPDDCFSCVDTIATPWNFTVLCNSLLLFIGFLNNLCISLYF